MDGFEFAECFECGAKGPYARGDRTREQQWNRRASPWISVEDRVPEEYRRVLIAINGETCRETAYYGPDEVFRYDCGYETIAGVTNWMPLPESPTEEG
jgi:hypothetical protein